MERYRKKITRRMSAYVLFFQRQIMSVMESYFKKMTTPHNQMFALVILKP